MSIQGMSDVLKIWSFDFWICFGFRYSDFGFDNREAFYEDSFYEDEREWQ